MKSIEQTMTELDHSYLSILKIDVEGSEWTAVAAMLENKKMRWLFLLAITPIYHHVVAYCLSWVILRRKLMAAGGISQLLFEFHWNPDTNAMNQRYEVILKRYSTSTALWWSFREWNIVFSQIDLRCSFFNFGQSLIIFYKAVFYFTWQIMVVLNYFINNFFWTCRLEMLGFVPWKIERHVGSDCCLDIRYDIFTY